MDRTFPLILYWFILGFFNLLRVYGNAEVNALNALKTQLQDPYNNLQSWNKTHVNPCLWYHITCNNENRTTRVDLGYAGLSGQLVPQLGQLRNLQYLILYGNNLTGEIPDELGNLTNLFSLELYLNRLVGDIPDTLGNLQKLRYLRLNNNNLTGTIPMSLTTIIVLQVIDLSNNFLTGIVPVNGSFVRFPDMSFVNNQNLTFPIRADYWIPPSQFITGNNDGGAFTKGVASVFATVIFSGNDDAGAFTKGAIVGAALVFAFQAISLFWRQRTKQQDLFTDVPGEEDN